VSNTLLLHRGLHYTRGRVQGEAIRAHTIGRRVSICLLGHTWAPCFPRAVQHTTLHPGYMGWRNSREKDIFFVRTAGIPGTPVWLAPINSREQSETLFTRRENYRPLGRAFTQILSTDGGAGVSPTRDHRLFEHPPPGRHKRRVLNHSRAGGPHPHGSAAGYNPDEGCPVQTGESLLEQHRRCSQ